MTRARKGNITVAVNTLAGRVIDENSLIDGGFIRYNQTNNNFVYFNLINNLTEGYLPVFSSGTFANSPIHLSGGEVSVVTPLILEKTSKYNTGYTPTGLEVPGESYWDANNYTYSDTLLFGVTGQRYQEDHWIIKNTSGSIIQNGSPVMYSGVIGSSGKLTGAAAIADGSKPAMYILGIATHQIAINGWGYITSRGNVRDLDTTGTPYGEIWNEEDIIYVSAVNPGWLTNVAPQAPNLAISVAVVAVKSSNNGELIVRPTWNPKLIELADVDGTPLTTTGQFPVWHQDTQVFDFDYNINDYLLKSAVETSKGLTGWLDGDNIGVAYNRTNRTITLTHASGHLEYAYRGQIRELGTTGTWTSTAHTATVGNWFLYSVDGTNFIWSNSSWAFADIMVAFVRYEATDVLTWAIRETHGTMDYESHEEFHSQIGTYRVNGGLVTAGTYAFNTATDNALSPGFDAFTIKDEDVLSLEPAWLEGGTYTTVYIGPGLTSIFDTTGTRPFIAAGVNEFIQVNDAAAGTMTPGINNRYYNVYQILVPAASDVDSQRYRMILAQPQAAYTTLEGAQAEDIRSISLGTFSNIAPEFVAYARITYLSGTGYSNYGKCVIPTGGISYVIGNRMGQVTVGGFTGTDHAALSSLEWLNSGHTGTTDSVAAFTGAGAATNILLNTIIQTTGDQTIGGTKTFTLSPIVPTPTSTTHAATKAYADTKVTANVAITPATKTKITYDSQGLVTLGEDAAISDITGLSTALSTTVSSTSTFGTDNLILRSDGTSRGAQSSNWGIDDNGKIFSPTVARSIYIGDAANGGTSYLTENVGIGSLYTLENVTTGFQNVAIGSNVLRYATTADSNVAIGTGAMRGTFGSPTTTIRNVAIGVSALRSMVGGEDNVAIGNNPLRTLLGDYVTGISNIAIGRWPHYDGISSNYIIAIGSQAARYLSNGITAFTKSTDGIYIGRDTKAFEDLTTNEIVIGCNAIGNGSNTIQLGNTNIILVKTSGGIVAPTIKLTTGAVNGYVLTSDASGNAAWSAGTPGSGVSESLAIAYAIAL